MSFSWRGLVQAVLTVLVFPLWGPSFVVGFLMAVIVNGLRKGFEFIE